VGISTVSKIFSYFPFLGVGGIDPRGHDLHSIGCSITQGTRIYMEYIGFRGGDLNNFQDIQQFPFPG
jgi:hypothetical protein